jgi:hypothetical protein
MGLNSPGPTYEASLVAGDRQGVACMLSGYGGDDT